MYTPYTLSSQVLTTIPRLAAFTKTLVVVTVLSCAILFHPAKTTKMTHFRLFECISVDEKKGSPEGSYYAETGEEAPTQKLQT